MVGFKAKAAESVASRAKTSVGSSKDTRHLNEIDDTLGGAFGVPTRVWWMRCLVPFLLLQQMSWLLMQQMSSLQTQQMSWLQAARGRRPND